MSSPNDTRLVNTTPLDVLVVEPYLVDSHEAWVCGWERHSAHRIDVISRPGERWRDRLRHASFEVAEEITSRGLTPDVLVVSSMTNLAQLVAIVPHLRMVPSVVMMHENHIAYPDRSVDGVARPNSSEFASVTIAALLAADAIVWNSDFHHSVVRRALDNQGLCSARQLAQIEHRSSTIPVGIEAPDAPTSVQPGGPPLILWNHRWDHDKGPQAFFAALNEIEDLDWRLAVVGRNTRTDPQEFRRARRRYADRIEEWGWAPPDRYRSLLHAANVVVSTAHHEFFGIAVIEAVAHGAVPLLPRRLAYPEVIPVAHHADVFYDELGEGLRMLLGDTDGHRQRIAGLADAVIDRFSWTSVAPRLDECVRRVHAGAQTPRPERDPGGGASTARSTRGS